MTRRPPVLALAAGPRRRRLRRRLPPGHARPAKYEPLPRQRASSRTSRSARPLVPGTVARGSLREDEVYFTGKQGKDFVSELPASVS